MTPLRQRFLEEMKLRNYSPRTVEAYLSGLLKLSKHFDRSPDRLDAEQIRTFQLHLIAQEVSWSRFNQITCALRFFYSQVLKRPPEQVPYVCFARKPQALPTILGPAEVKQLIEADFRVSSTSETGHIQSKNRRKGEKKCLRIGLKER